MEITQVKRPYELLIRWDKDGNIAGAHRIDRNYLIDDHGNVLGESDVPAEPLSLVNLHEDPIMSEATASALATVEKHKAKIADLQEQVEVSENDAAAARARAQELAAEVAKLEVALAEERLARLELERAADTDGVTDADHPA